MHFSIDGVQWQYLFYIDKILDLLLVCYIYETHWVDGNFEYQNVDKHKIILKLGNRNIP